MKILHLCLSNYYIDDFSYQENELVSAHVADGHEVLIVASTETFGEDKKIKYLNPSEYMGSDGARVIRLPYRSWMPHIVMRKLRMFPKVMEVLESFKPDVILFHGSCGWEIFTVAKYVRAHRDVKLYLDSHEDLINSGRTWLSKWGLHFLYYRTIFRMNLRHVERILCVSYSSLEYLRDFFGAPSSKLEFFPLGGQLLENAEYDNRRSSVRRHYGLTEKSTLFVQSGKFGKAKKLVEALLDFSKTPDPEFRLFICGHLESDIESQAKALISADPRIQFLGWQSPEDLRSLLCAADAYLQPGTQSATMQMSLCCRCPVIIDDIPGHAPYINGNGWLVGKAIQMEAVFEQISRSPGILSAMSRRSNAIASELLNYKVLATRLYR